MWVDHFRKGNARLTELLITAEVRMHPFVIGELSCGNLARCEEVLGLLDSLPKAPALDHEEVLEFVAANRLHGRGLGWIDMHLLASARLARLPLWTLDKRLAADDLASSHTSSRVRSAQSLPTSRHRLITSGKHSLISRSRVGPAPLIGPPRKRRRAETEYGRLGNHRAGGGASVISVLLVRPPSFRLSGSEKNRKIKAPSTTLPNNMAM